MAMRISRLRIFKVGLIRQEEGSISVLIIGLFLITVSLLFIMTDIATIAVAKRSLVQASESAVLRGVQSIDRAGYYNQSTGVAIPIDCSLAKARVLEELASWSASGSDLKRSELSEVQLQDFYCQANTVSIQTSARALLPFHLPQSILTDFQVTASAGAQSNRAQ